MARVMKGSGKGERETLHVALHRETDDPASTGGSESKPSSTLPCPLAPKSTPVKHRVTRGGADDDDDGDDDAGSGKATRVNAVPRSV